VCLNGKTSPKSNEETINESQAHNEAQDYEETINEAQEALSTFV